MSIFLLKCASRLLNLLPQRLVLLVGDIIGSIWFWLIPIRRSTVIENLTTTFGAQYSKREIWALAARNYRHYGRSLIEMVESVTWTREDYRARTIVEGLENCEKFYHNGKGGFFLTLHLGNWEVMIGSGASAGIPVDVVVKYARSAFFEHLLSWYRDRLGVNVFLESGTAKDILRSISKGRFVGFILDQFMGPPIGLNVSFFGRPAGTTVSLALLADKTGAPVCPGYSYRDANGVVHIVIEPALTYPELSADRNERLYQLTQLYNDVLERIVRKYPEQWLWLHRRWKPFVGESKWVLKGGVSPVKVQ